MTFPASARCKRGTDETTCISASQGGLAARTHGQLGNSQNGVSEPAGDLRTRGDGNSQGIQLLSHGKGYRAVNDTIEPAATPMPNLEDKALMFAGATAWCCKATGRCP